MRTFDPMSSVSGKSQSVGEIEEGKREPSSLSSTQTSTYSLSEHTSVSVDSESYEDTIYVAVGKDFKESKSTLEWTLSYFQSLKKIYIVHVHIPAQTIPMMGGRFPISKLSNQEVKAYHLREKEKKDKTLSKYFSIVHKEKVQAEKLMIEKDNVAKGLTELITQFNIKKLVMGTAADTKYSRNMKMLKSNKARSLCEEAPQSCQIWFVCKRHLICTRDDYVNKLSTVSPSIRSVQSEQSQSKSSGSWLNQFQELFKNKAAESQSETTEHLKPPASKKEKQGFMWEEFPRSFQDSNSSSMTQDDETTSNFNSITAPEEEEESSIDHSKETYVEDPHNSSLYLQANINSSIDISKERGSTSPLMVPTSKDPEGNISLQQELIPSEMDDIYDELEKALNEAAKLKEEAHEESCKYHMARRKELAAIKRAKDLELDYTKAMKLRKEVEEAFEKEKLVVKNLTRRQSEIFEELQTACNQKLALEDKLTESNGAVRNLTEQLESLKQQHHLDSLKQEQDDLQGGKNAEKQHQAEAGVSSSSPKLPSFLEFSYLELQEACNDFDRSFCIGEGGYGCVYKGFLRHTTVAIKRLHSKSSQGLTEFWQEVDILSRVRHPNLVTLIGACTEQCILVYEFLPNGSLEDRLSCVGNTPPLSWQVRTRICAEMCSTLMFLQSNKTQSVVHGDLKPANILLDENFTCKLSDFGISRLLVQSSNATTPYYRTDPKGTFVYLDPEFVMTGELTTQSDVYSFGVIILRLLTGKPPLGIVKAVKEALDNERLQNILDPTAGTWSFAEAQQLALLGVRCCEINRKNRPELVRDVWRILEPMKNASMLRPSLGPSKEKDYTRSYFICPVSQEIMRDPHIAADGYTYEAEAIRQWLQSGNDRSPVTGLKLENHQLIPNHGLRAAIQDWQHHGV